MVTSNSRLSYTDCFDLFDQALADTAGIRIEFATEGEAMQYRVRMHTARQINRKDNRETYTADHPMHGQSPYDELVIRIRKFSTGFWLYIQKIGKPRKVESLAEIETETEIEEIEVSPTIPVVAPLSIQPIRRRA